MMLFVIFPQVLLDHGKTSLLSLKMISLTKSPMKRCLTGNSGPSTKDNFQKGLGTSDSHSLHNRHISHVLFVSYLRFKLNIPGEPYGSTT